MSNAAVEGRFVRILNKGKHPLPNYATEHSAGMDRPLNPYF